MTSPSLSWQGEPITDDLVLSCFDANRALIGVRADHLRDRWNRKSEAYFASKFPEDAVASHALPGSGTTEVTASTAAVSSTGGEGL